MALCLLASLWIVAVPWRGAIAQERTALLMDGKSSLYQRVLTRPGAAIHVAPDGNAPASADVQPLSMFFVYDRRLADGSDWIEVGPASTGLPVGWMPAAMAIDWKQTLTVAFTNPVNRDRALFFRDRDYLLDLIESEMLVPTVDGYRDSVSRGAVPADSPLVSIEPATHIDLTENFYLLPILDYDYAYFETGFSSLVLQVAAATLHEPVDDPLKRGLAVELVESQGDLMQGYRAGVVFVVDTTTSMGPYIERTRTAVRSIYRQLAGSPWGDRVSFGLVAYRDDLTTTPGLEYVSQVYANLDDGRSEATFFNQIARVEPASVSSRGFNEDAYAGVLAAIRDIDWTGYGGRFIVLITDAGARAADDPFSATRRGGGQVRLLAQENGIAIFALHLLTPEGRQNHEYAAGQYTALSHWPNVGSLYYGVQAGALDTFGDRVDGLAGALVSQVATAAEGRLTDVTPDPPDAGADQAANELEARTAMIGRAMQLAYLGRAAGTEVPRLFDSWVADRDLINPSLKTLEVRVLITKNQLSDLQATLLAIIEAAEQTRIAPRDFFRQLQSAAAAMSRRPEDIASGDVRRLADLGLVGEYLEDLPYQSRIMELTEDDWLSWSFGQQREFLDDLEAKLVLYEDLHDDTDLWIALGVDRVRGDAVYPIPLDALP
ncbi:MAG: vWA domain-containing protein [Alphaproteobacteria bacterium]